MKLKIVLLLLVTIMYSCGSSKNVASNKKVVSKRTAPQPKVVKKEEVKEVANRVPKPRPVIEEKAPEVYKPKPVPVKTVSKPQSHSELTQEYILKFADEAVREMHQYKIPASITLAQGVLESGSGKSELALKSNNHFGIKCHKGWKGNSVSHDDDAIGECFRKYDDPKKSYVDHSLFLTSRKRYAGLFKLHPTDYTGWAHGLRKAGYATDPRYPQKLISIINRYNLHTYDLIENPNKKHVNYTETSSPLGSSYHTVKKGDTLYSISRMNGISVEELKKNNSLFNNNLSIGQKLRIH